MRALRRSIAWLVLAGFLAGQGAVWVAAHHASLEDDTACADVDGPQLIGPHHQFALQFEETNPPSPIEHCALCHLQRAVSSARLSLLSVAAIVRRVICAPVEFTTALALVIHPGLPSRGPPANLA